MVNVLVQREYEHPAAAVWGVLEDFGDISWAPGMDSVKVVGEGPGMERHIPLPDGAAVVERLESIDPAAMTFTYTIPSGAPMPVSDYRATAKVSDAGSGRCRIDWSCTARADGVSDEEAGQIVEGFYQQLLGWIGDEVARRAG